MRSPQSGCQLPLEEVCCLATRIQESKKRPKPSRSDIYHARSNSTCAMTLTPRHQSPRNEVQIHGVPGIPDKECWRIDKILAHTTQQQQRSVNWSLGCKYGTLCPLCDIYGWVGGVHDISSGSKVTYLCQGGSMRCVAKVT